MLKIKDELLKQVSKPARYIGNEVNVVKKDLANIDIRFALCFPDVYEIGMSHLGLQILYYFLNRRMDTFCERCYAPWIDMEQIMREENIPLFALESQDELKKFDIIGFTLQYEMSYTNIVNMLDLAGIPILRCERSEDMPIIVAGGPCAYNPEPLADIIDFFYIGEGEVKYDEILNIYKQNKKEGGGKSSFLEKLLAVDGVYVPSFYNVSYKENGEIEKFYPISDNAKTKIEKVAVMDLDKAFYPEKQLVPLIEVVHDRVTLEVFRGCIRGCRFCQAGYIYRPVREKSASTLIEQADNLLKYSGHEEISLVSLSTCDYSQFKTLAEGLFKYKDEMINISLPSLRIDAVTIDLMKKAQEVRKSGITFAPEAGTQRLRDVINKNLTEEEILNGSFMAFDAGWDKVKLYFMIGLPTETKEDIYAIADLSNAIVEKYYEVAPEKRKRAVLINVSASAFVPKPFTPFQWEGQDSVESFKQKQHLLKNKTKKQIKLNYHDAQLSRIEGVISRGDRRIGAAIIKAWELGCRFDGWSELFEYKKWVQAFEELSLSMDFYACRERSFDEILPWDHISIGIQKEYLIEERKKAAESMTTANCRQSCSNCGASSYSTNSIGGCVCYEI